MTLRVQIANVRPGYDIDKLKSVSDTHYGEP